MFNNPLNSFHEIVAEAKEEREQLDRLLTISTPRERLLVVAIALVLGTLLAWLFLGSVSRSLVVDGVLVVQGETLSGQGEPLTVQGETPPGQGETLSGESGAVQVRVWVGRDIAPRIEAGVSVVIEPDAADGESGALAGTVRAVSAVPLSGEPGASEAAFEAAAPLSAHRIDIALETTPEEGLDPDSLAGRKCRIVIELGRQSPIALFLAGQP